MKRTKNTIQHDKLDKINFEEVRDESQALHKTVEESEEELSTADALSEDIFYSLFKSNPKENPDDKIEEPYNLNKDFMEKVTNSKEYENLRCTSKLDKTSSAIATKGFMENMMSEFKQKELDEINEKAEQVKEGKEQIEKMKRQIEGLEDADREDKIDDEELREKLEKRQKELEEHEDDLDKQIEKKTSTVRTAIRDSLEEGEKQSEQSNEVLAGWGFGHGEKQKLSWQERMDLAEEIEKTPKLKEISKIIGNMKRLAISVQKKKIRKVPEEIQDIEKGNDLSKVLPSQLVHLDSETEILFLKKYALGQLLQYKLDGQEKEGEGPIIACVDTSGSMEGEREIWSKGLLGGLFNIAKRQDRPFHVILFSNGIAETTISRDSGKQRIEDFKEVLGTFLGGGTNFDKPLRAAIDKIDVDSDFEKADIVFITDGVAKVSPAVQQNIDMMKDELDFQIIGLGVASSAGGLDDFCDSIFMIDDFSKDGNETAKDVFQLL